MEVLAATPICCIYGHPPCGQQKGSSSTLSGLELQLRSSAALLDSPGNKTAIHALLFGGALSSFATYNPPSQFVWFKKFQTFSALNLYESRQSESNVELTFLPFLFLFESTMYANHTTTTTNAARHIVVGRNPEVPTSSSTATSRLITGPHDREGRLCSYLRPQRSSAQRW